MACAPTQFRSSLLTTILTGLLLAGGSGAANAAAIAGATPAPAEAAASPASTAAPAPPPDADRAKTSTAAGSPMPATVGLPAAAPLFATEVTRVTWPIAPAPASAAVLRWDFSRPATFTYDFRQEARNRHESSGFFAGRPPDRDEHAVTVSGRMMVATEGSGTASLQLSDMLATAVQRIEGRDAQRRTQGFPGQTVEGMHEDGTAPFGASSFDSLLRLLFPLPQVAMRPGDTVELPAHLPFNANGHPLRVEGCSRVTLRGFVAIDDRTCAWLDVVTEIASLTGPSEVEGRHTGSLTGTAAVWFDLADRALAGGRFACRLEVDSETPLPKLDQPDPELPVASQMRTRLVSENFIELTRRRSADAAGAGSSGAK